MNRSRKFYAVLARIDPLAALEHIDRDAAAGRARELLEQGGLQQTTRQDMKRYLLRYDKGESGA